MNRVTLIGNLGKTPEVKDTPTGKRVADLSVATTKYIGQGEGRKQVTDWHHVVAWDYLASRVQAAEKGARVYVEGELRTRSWEVDGQKKYKTEIVAAAIEILERRQEQQTTDNPLPF